MTRLLDKEQVAVLLGVRPKTAAALMMEMNPIAVTGKVRHRYVVTEDNLEKWIIRKSVGRNQTGNRAGSKKRLERR